MDLPCPVPTCTRRAIIDADGQCGICSLRLCIAHVSSPQHPCSALSDTAYWAARARALRTAEAALLVDVAYVPIAAHARAARIAAGDSSAEDPGEPTVALPEPGADGLLPWTYQGGFNLALPLTFPDGIAWLARVRKPGIIGGGRSGGGAARSVRRAVMGGDFASHAVAHAAAPALVPACYAPPGEVFDVASPPFGVDYVLVRRGAGELLQTCTPEPGTVLPEPRATTVRDVARLFVALAAVPFTGVGSLRPATTAKSEVGPLRALDFGAGTWPLGPFPTSQACWLARIDAVLGAIRAGAMYVHAPLEAYLVHLEARMLVAGCDEMGVAAPTYLRHGDMSGGNVMLMEDGSVGAVIDWEFATTLPLAEAFTLPPAFWDRISFDAGSNALFPAEVALAAELRGMWGRDDLARAVEGGRKYHRLGESIAALDGWSARGLCAMREAFEEESDTATATATARRRPRYGTMAEWCAAALERYAADSGLQALLAALPGHERAMAGFKGDRAREVERAGVAQALQAEEEEDGHDQGAGEGEVAEGARTEDGEEGEERQEGVKADEDEDDDDDDGVGAAAKPHPSAPPRRRNWHIVSRMAPARPPPEVSSSGGIGGGR